MLYCAVVRSGCRVHWQLSKARVAAAARSGCLTLLVISSHVALSGALGRGQGKRREVGAHN